MNRRDFMGVILFVIFAAVAVAFVFWLRRSNLSKQPQPVPRMIFLEMRQYDIAAVGETLYVLRYFDREEYRVLEVQAYSWPAISKVREVMK